MSKKADPTPASDPATKPPPPRIPNMTRKDGDTSTDTPATPDTPDTDEAFGKLMTSFKKSKDKAINLESENKELMVNLGKKEQDCVELEQQKNALEQQKNALEQQVEALRKIETEAEKSKDKAINLESENKELMVNLGKKEQDCVELEQQKNALEQQVEALRKIETEAEENKGKVNDLELQNKSLEDSLGKRVRDYGELERQKNALEQQVEALRKKKTEAEGLRSMARRGSVRSNILSTVMAVAAVTTIYVCVKKF